MRECGGFSNRAPTQPQRGKAAKGLRGILLMTTREAPRRKWHAVDGVYVETVLPWLPRGSRSVAERCDPSRQATAVIHNSNAAAVAPRRRQK